MKLINFEVDGNKYSGVLQDNKISLGEKVYDLDKVKILPPCMPSKAVCVGLNYRDHAEELGIAIPKEPVIFMKPPTTIIAHKENIIYPKMSTRVDYEGELGVVIKKTAKNVDEKDAKEFILGYTCANDVTARDLQKKDGQWTVCKSFDTFLPIGPVIETSIDPDHLEIKTYVNDELKQHSNTKHLIFNVYFLISYISQVMTLLPGDIILTGTPAGIGPTRSGDKVSIEIEKIGTLINYVK
ncbi:MAG: 5-carboxymethyl-2-hydroxymuconate Delta-isomerase [Clostridia bacterium]|nr:5-carboxymethyl-2-hydroxymuconate Delta-isomerase [Clostridia bacterium]